MSTFLHLIRQPPDLIPASVFLASEATGDIVLLEAAASASLSGQQGTVYVVTSEEQRDASDLTYEKLVEKIFESDHVMVI
jgi:hypothetical protein